MTSTANTDKDPLLSSHIKHFQRKIVVNPSAAKAPGSEHRFSLVAFNILAEVHRVRADYSYTEEQYLEQDYRHARLMKDLQELDADVVCLQEVGPEYYKTKLLPALEQLGYCGQFVKRTQEYFNEGEATFFKSHRFSLEAWTSCSLAKSMMEEVEKKTISSPDVKEAIRNYLDRSEVINVCRLKCKVTDKIVAVGNVHIVWDDNILPDVKALEVASAVKELLLQTGSDLCPHILCGDFNSVPTSEVYQFTRDGHLSDSSIASLQAVENLELQTGAKSLITYLPDMFRHRSGSLTSAYFACKDEEPEVTCYDRQSWGCFDYIWFSQSELSVTDVLDLPSKKLLDSTGGLPNKFFSSDHLPLKATFCFQ